jgi:hypothetical protein
MRFSRISLLLLSQVKISMDFASSLSRLGSQWTLPFLSRLGSQWTLPPLSHGLGRNGLCLSSSRDLGRNGLCHFSLQIRDAFGRETPVSGGLDDGEPGAAFERKTPGVVGC